MKKKIAVGYIRVSTEEQAKDGYSLDNQESVINKKNVITKNGMNIGRK